MIPYEFAHRVRSRSPSLDLRFACTRMEDILAGVLLKISRAVPAFKKRGALPKVLFISLDALMPCQVATSILLLLSCLRQGRSFVIAENIDPEDRCRRIADFRLNLTFRISPLSSEQSGETSSRRIDRNSRLAIRNLFTRENPEQQTVPCNQ